MLDRTTSTRRLKAVRRRQGCGYCPPSAAALRARERRARLRAGITRDLRVRVPTRRLLAAMRAANPLQSSRFHRAGGGPKKWEALRLQTAPVLARWRF
jgi:hypothetical protein